MPNPEEYLNMIAHMLRLGESRFDITRHIYVRNGTLEISHIPTKEKHDTQIATITPSQSNEGLTLTQWTALSNKLQTAIKQGLLE